MSAPASLPFYRHGPKSPGHGTMVGRSGNKSASPRPLEVCFCLLALPRVIFVFVYRPMDNTV
jgi:hypothetical protein